MSLYQNTLDALRRTAAEEFARSDIGRMYAEVDRMVRRGTAGQRDLERLSRNLRRLRSTPSITQTMQQTGLDKVLGSVDRYARKGVREAVLQEVLGALGPVGGLIESLLRPGGNPSASVQKELDAAANLLQAFGYRVEAPQSPAHAAQNLNRDVEDSKRLLESLGFTVTPPPQEQSQPPGTVRPGQRPSFETIGGGRIKTPDANDPLLTGEWVNVSSSNVHSIRWIWNDANPMMGTLAVRYHNHRKNSHSSHGATYHYYNVHPQLFEAFRRSASKGRWVWDHLRIRGTVSGHQYRYGIAAISSDGYVPRQATRLGPKEYFLQRQVTSQGGREYTSALQDQFVKFWEPNRGAPKTGAPRRGTPNRGAPRRGR